MTDQAQPIPPCPSPAEFSGRVAVVTGGTDGLGLHLARTLAAMDCHVWVCGRSAERGANAVEQMGGRGHFHQCDLADPIQARGFVEAAGNAAGAIDYLVNNAAMDTRVGFEEATDELFDRFIAINLRPLFSVTQTALPWLRKGQGKAVVNIGTTNYMLGLSPFTLYNAGKSGIVGFTRSLARELGPEGIRVNMVSPGWVMTPKQLREHVTPEDQAELLQDQCMKDLLREEHLTPAVLFLLSASSAGITGQNLVVDAGKVMQ